WRPRGGGEGRAPEDGRDARRAPADSDGRLAGFGGQVDPAALLPVALEARHALGDGGLVLVQDRDAALDLAGQPLVVDDLVALEGETEHTGLGGGAVEVVEDEVAQT